MAVVGVAKSPPKRFGKQCDERGNKKGEREKAWRG